MQGCLCSFLVSVSLLFILILVTFDDDAVVQITLCDIFIVDVLDVVDSCVT